MPELEFSAITPRQKLHLLIEELNDAEVAAALARLSRELDLFTRWPGV